MKQFIFLTLAEVLAIHQDQVSRYGGSRQIRDIGLLESALAMPKAGFGGEYVHRDICEMAAAYLFHIVKNHPFIDGNKRTGAMAAYVFLVLNGIILNIKEQSFEDLVWKVSKGQADKLTIAKFFRGKF